MQHSPPSSLPSLSSTNPINGEVEAQRAHDEASGVTDSTARSIKQAAGLAKKTTHQKAVQSAKQEIRSKLRENWYWPALDALHEAPQGHDDLNLPQSDVVWQERETDSSHSSPSDPYRYESPDAVAEPINRKKRRRHQLESEELAWNHGLRHFMERRNAWTGSRAQITPSGSSQESVTSSSHFASDDTNTSMDTSVDMSMEKSQPMTTNGILQSYSSDALAATTVVPLAPPILPPDHEVRAAITPAAYPSIYSKIIVQGLTPTIPINLQDLVGALVEGWKKDGEWPPKSQNAGIIENGDIEQNCVKGGGKRLARKGMGKVKKALGLGHEDQEGTVDNGGPNGARS